MILPNTRGSPLFMLFHDICLRLFPHQQWKNLLFCFKYFVDVFEFFVISEFICFLVLFIYILPLWFKDCLFLCSCFVYIYICNSYKINILHYITSLYGFISCLRCELKASLQIVTFQRWRVRQSSFRTAPDLPDYQKL